MGAWALDVKALERDVLEPMKAEWNARSDLFRVYQLDVDESRPEVIALAVREMGRHLEGKRSPQYKELGRIHKKAAVVLQDNDERARHRAEVLTRRRTMADELRRFLGGAPGVPPAELDRQTARSRGHRSRAELRDALAAAGGTEAEPFALPDPAKPAEYSRLRRDLRGVAGVDPHDPFPLHGYLGRLKGPRTTAADLVGRQRELRSEREDETTDEINVIKRLQAYLSEGLLSDALWCDVRDALGRPSADYAALIELTSTPAVAPTLEARRLTARDLAYAVWCERATAAHPFAEAERLLAQRDLQAARTWLASRGTLPPEWHERLRQLDEELTRIRERLDHATSMLAEGDVEGAAAALHSLQGESANPRIAETLRRCTPEPPRSLQRIVVGTDVTVRWTASTSCSGRISYRVTRVAGERATVLVDDTTVTRFADRGVPPATPLTYEVVTVRDAGEPTASESPAQTVAVPPLLPRATALVADETPERIRLSWQAPPAAVGARLVRRRHPAEPLVTWDLGRGVSGHDDASASPGVRYTYVLRLRYDVNGPDEFGAPVDIEAGRPRTPEEVQDLAVAAAQDDLCLSWSPPPAGTVEFLITDTGHGPAPGRVPAARLRNVARLTAAPSGAGTARAPLPIGRRGFDVVPVTVLDGLATVGKFVTVDWVLPPVDGLEATVRGREVHLGWRWPESVVEVLVEYARTNAATEPESDRRLVARGEYESQGCRIECDRGDWTFTVIPITTRGGVRRRGPSRSCRHTVRDEAQFALTRWWRAPRTGLRVVLLWDREEPAPGIRVVAKDGVRPRSVDDGELLALLPPGSRDRVLHARRPLGMTAPHVQVFSDDTTVLLVPATARSARGIW